MGGGNNNSIRELMNSGTRLFVVLAAVGMLAVPEMSWSGTWNVEKDGSGDFTVIQHAVDAAADGDTILIGPGRYDDYATYDTVDGTLICYVYIPDKSLTLVGSGMGMTVIGPASEIHPVTEHERGINAAYYGAGELFISDLTVEHLNAGILIGHQSGRIERCEFRNHSRGTALIVAYTAVYEVKSCVFTNYVNGIFPAGCDGLRIVDTVFQDNYFGVNSTSATGMEIINCMYENNTLGVQLFSGSAASIQGCVFNTSHPWGEGIAATMGSAVEILNTEIRPGGAWGIQADGGSSVSGSGNVVAAGTTAVIDLMNANMTMGDSHILADGGLAVKCRHLIDDTWTIDLRNNWWGVADASTIADLIHDGTDDPEIPAIVLFEPFADGEVPNESMSWGTLKNLYR